MKIKNKKQLIDLELRFLYEQTLGREIRANLWNSLKTLLRNAGLVPDSDNITMLAMLHKSSPSVIRHQQNINLIATIQNKASKDKTTGQEIKSFVISLIHSKQDIAEPSNATVYRWFRKTKPGGYKGVSKLYDKFDLCTVCIAALNYQPKNNVKPLASD
jgi:hypothetical protein